MRNIAGSIYIIKNKINDKVYIGQTILLVEERFKQHMKPSIHKKKYKIYKAIKKHGADNFYYEVLETNIDINILDKKEIEYIEKYNSFKNGYNSTKGGDGRIINKIEDVECIIKELECGRLIKDIAREMGIHPSTISRTIKNPSQYNKNKKIIASLRKVSRDDVEKLILLGYSGEEISEIMNVNEKTVRRISKELGFESERPRYDYSCLDRNKIIKDKQDGMKLSDICKKYQISKYAYYKIIKSQKENSNDYPAKE